MFFEENIYQYNSGVINEIILLFCREILF